MTSSSPLLPAPEQDCPDPHQELIKLSPVRWSRWSIRNFRWDFQYFPSVVDIPVLPFWKNVPEKFPGLPVEQRQSERCQMIKIFTWELVLLEVFLYRLETVETNHRSSSDKQRVDVSIPPREFWQRFTEISYIDIQQRPNQGDVDWSWRELLRPGGWLVLVVSESHISTLPQRRPKEGSNHDDNCYCHWDPHL